jgi:hypothetical protein
MKERVDFAALSAAVFGTMAKVGEKHFERDCLADGAAIAVDMAIVGNVDGRDFSLPLGAMFTVGHASKRAGNVNAPPALVIAAILSKLNAATRGAVCRDIVNEWQESKTLAVDDDYVSIADDMLAALRHATTVDVRGAVKVNTTTAKPEIEFRASA